MLGYRSIVHTVGGEAAFRAVFGVGGGVAFLCPYRTEEWGVSGRISLSRAVVSVGKKNTKKNVTLYLYNENKLLTDEINYGKEKEETLYRYDKNEKGSLGADYGYGFEAAVAVLPCFVDGAVVSFPLAEVVITAQSALSFFLEVVVFDGNRENVWGKGRRGSHHKIWLPF